MDSSLNNNYHQLNYLPYQTANLNNIYNYTMTNQQPQQQLKTPVSISSSMIDHGYSGFGSFYQPSMPLTNSENYYYYPTNNNMLTNDYNSAMSTSLNTYMNYNNGTSSHRQSISTPIHYNNNDDVKVSKNNYNTDRSSHSSRIGYTYDPYIGYIPSNKILIRIIIIILLSLLIFMLFQK
jgi:hypothetical protein